jgi:chemotaxis protein CheD
VVVQVVVHISDGKVSASREDMLVTYSLGSCVGVTLYDPVARIAGMLHYQLPSSSLDPERAKDKPFMFADSGMQLLLSKMMALGAEKRRIKTKLAGAAQMLNDAALFNIGRRNHAAVRKFLWQQGMLIEAEDVGGNTPRTLNLSVSDGKVTVRSGQETHELKGDDGL